MVPPKNRKYIWLSIDKLYRKKKGKRNLESKDFWMFDFALEDIQSKKKTPIFNGCIGSLKLMVS